MVSLTNYINFVNSQLNPRNNFIVPLDNAWKLYNYVVWFNDYIKYLTVELHDVQSWVGHLSDERIMRLVYLI